MAQNDPHTGKGAELQMGDGASPENFRTVLGIKTISLPNITRDTHDTTDLSTESNWRSFIGGMSDGGEISFGGNFLPFDDTQNGEETGAYNGLLAEFSRDSCNSLRKWRILLPDCPGDAQEGYFEFDGIVNGFGGDIGPDLMGVSGSIKVSGQPNLILESN